MQDRTFSTIIKSVLIGTGVGLFISLQEPLGVLLAFTVTGIWLAELEHASNR